MTSAFRRGRCHAHAEPVHGDDDGDRTVVDGAEGGGASAVGADQGVEAVGRLHLLDVDARVEAATLCAQHHHVRGRVPARRQ